MRNTRRHVRISFELTRRLPGLTRRYSSAAATELTISHWTRLEPVGEAKTAPASPTPASGSSAIANRRPDAQPASEVVEKVEEHYVHQPLFKRIGFALLQSLLGVGIAVVFLESRGRLVRKLYIIPTPSTTATASSSSTKSLIIQSARHLGMQGRLYPMERASLEWGPYSKHTNEVFLQIDGLKGRFTLLMDEVEIEGKLLTKWDARVALYDSFYGKNGKKIMAQQCAVAGQETPAT